MIRPVWFESGPVNRKVLLFFLDIIFVVAFAHVFIKLKLLDAFSNRVELFLEELLVKKLA